MDMTPIVSALSGFLVSKKFTAPIETVNNIWNMTLGYYIERKTQEVKIFQDSKLESYKIAKGILDRDTNDINLLKEEVITELKDYFSNPLFNIQEPNLILLNKALKAAPDYIQISEIRSLFAKSIASTIDSDKASYFHPSFIEIIKHLSPVDVQNLKYFEEQGELPLIRVQTTYEDGKYANVNPHHIFLGNDEQVSLEMQALSISNLERLGIISTTYSSSLHPNEEIYPPIIDSEPVQDLLESTKKYIMKENDSQELAIHIRYGGAMLTTLGQSFIYVCL